MPPKSYFCAMRASALCRPGGLGDSIRLGSLCCFRLLYEHLFEL